MDVSENSGTPKSSILIRFSIFKSSILGYPNFWVHTHTSPMDGMGYVVVFCPFSASAGHWIRVRFQNLRCWTALFLGKVGGLWRKTWEIREPFCMVLLVFLNIAFLFAVKHVQKWSVKLEPLILRVMLCHQKPGPFQLKLCKLLFILWPLGSMGRTVYLLHLRWFLWEISR